METTKSNPILKLAVSREQGGMDEMSKSGTYPDYLNFYSDHYLHHWKHRLKAEKQSGVLKIKGRKVYRYIYDGSVCKIMPVIEGNTVEEWITVDMMHIMKD